MSTDKKGNDFDESYLKGNIGQQIVQFVFRRFKYKVYGFGAEDRLGHMVHEIAHWKSPEALRIRQSPDYVVLEPKTNQPYFVEVKATTISPAMESRYKIKKEKLQGYREYWPEQFLVVLCIKSMKIYCKRVCDLQWDSLKADPDHYLLDLKRDFLPFHKAFKGVEAKALEGYLDEARAILGNFNLDLAEGID